VFEFRHSFAALLIILTAIAWAQEPPRFEVAGEYANLRSNTTPGGTPFHMDGFAGSAALNLRPMIAVVADIGTYYQGDVQGTKTSLRVTTYLFGPRVALRKYPYLTPFAHGLFGAAHAGGSLYTQPSVGSSGALGANNGFAVAVGGGLDLSLRHSFAFRIFQAEYLNTDFLNGKNNRQNNLRLGAGVVFRWGEGTAGSKRLGGNK
jgi:outer membrane immunogenic protein